MQTKAIRVEPTDEYPVPYDLSDEKPTNFLDELTLAGNTAELLGGLGAPPPEVDESDYEREKELITKAIANQDPSLLNTYPAALGAAAFVKAYGAALAHDVTQVRNALTNKLLEIADHDDPKYSLKAIELLGKHSDIGLFTERSEININYNSPEALEGAILERVNRLIHASTPNTPPLGMDLDEELGIYGVEEAEFHEVEETPPPAETEEDNTGETDEAG